MFMFSIHLCLLQLQCLLQSNRAIRLVEGNCGFSIFFFFNVISTPVIYSGCPFFSRTSCEDGEICTAAVLLPGYVSIRLPALPIHQVSPDMFTQTLHIVFIYIADCFLKLFQSFVTSQLSCQHVNTC